MRRAASVLLVSLAVFIGTSRAGEDKQTSQSPAEAYKALVARYRKAQTDFFKAYRAAKTQEEKLRVFRESYPKPADFARQFMKIAEEHPDDPAAVQALVWVITRAGSTQEGRKALTIFMNRHLNDPKAGEVCLSLVYSSHESAEDLMRAVLKENKDRRAQGLACYALAQYLQRHRKTKEAEELFERVAKEFGDITAYGRPLGDRAKGALNEIRNLAIGKMAPEIEGEDIDGKRFKLSDYRGKVVVLDFWGHW